MSLKIWNSKDQLASADLNSNFAAVLAMSVYNENLTALTGTEVTFDTAFPYKPGTLRVYASTSSITEMARKKLKTGTGADNGDYEEILDDSGLGVSFRFLNPPAAAAKLVVDYQKALP